jgi:cytochrome-b5 reductase
MSRVATALQPLRQTNLSAVVGITAAAGIGATIYYRTMTTAHADSGAPKKLFTGMVMTSLPLASSETVNHNTKRLRFKLPENAISGYPLTCKLDDLKV